jgi:tetratricopeptide (TPR) repeat protein
MMKRTVIILALAMAGSEPGASAQTEMGPLGLSFSSAPGAGSSQEDDLYRLGTNSLYEGRWDAAMNIFDEVLKQHGSRAAASLYWKAYALNKLGRSQDALKALAELHKSYSQSQWIREADALELEINARSVAGGVVGSSGLGLGGGSGIASMESSDEDLKLLALNTLMRSDPARAMPALKKLLASNSSPQLKDRVLFVLAQSNAPEAQRLLLETAKTQSDPGLRRRAIALMAAQPTQEHLAALDEIYRTSGDRIMRKSILDALIEMGAAKELIAIDRKEKDPQLHRKIVEGLSNLSSPEAQDYVKSERPFAKDKKITPEEVVAKHLKSIGKPEIVASIKSRTVLGTASVEFITGNFGNLPPGQSLFVSEGPKLGIIMKFHDFGYPGEYFAYDGHDVTIGYINFGARSQLGDFIRDYHGLMREGLLGGALSLAWPLLDIQERRPKLKYAKRKIDGRQLHELTYLPKSTNGMLQLQIRLFFDLETFRHVMTEYRFFYFDYRQLLQEQFEDFREVDGLMLPHRYTIVYSTAPAAFITRWTIKAEQWLHNVPIDPALFKARPMYSPE